MFSVKADIAFVVPAQAAAHNWGFSDMEGKRGGFIPCGPFGFGPCKDALLHLCNPCEGALVPSSGSRESLQGDVVAEGTAMVACPPCVPFLGPPRHVVLHGVLVLFGHQAWLGGHGH